MCTRGRGGVPCEECQRYWAALSGDPEQGDPSEPNDTCSVCLGTGISEVEVVHVISGSTAHVMCVPTDRPPMGRAPTSRPPHFAAI